MFRHSCGVCHFTNTARPSDITLADFWGWEKNVPNMNDDDKGVSLVLLNTEKGRLIFEKACGTLDVKELNMNDCLQPNLQHPSEMHPNRAQFEEDYKRFGFSYVIKRYGDIGCIYKVKSLIDKIRRKLKSVINRLFG